MDKQERITALVRLGDHLRTGQDDFLGASIKRTALHNGWLTEDNQRQAIEAIAGKMLTQEALDHWLANYRIPEANTPHTVGLVMAGNLPLVGFHDLLCVFASGHRAQIKLSDKDPYLLPALLRALRLIDARTERYFQVAERLSDFDVVIATGSNNSARYFGEYFARYPHIIRRNRNAVAVLTGNETPEELAALGHDVFDYFGLGCRNVAKLYVPENYDFEPLLEALHEFRAIVRNNKYKNNFDYNYALYMLNSVVYKGNGCVLLTENTSLQSPIAGLHYEFYDDRQALAEALRQRSEEIQLIVSHLAFPDLPVFPFGAAQQPGLADYADGVDTMEFLLNLPIT